MYDGECIEKKIDRMLTDGEPIEDTAPVIYTEYKDGVLPATDIRTDRMELAISAMDYIHKTNMAKKQQMMDGIEPKKEPTDPTVIKNEVTNNPEDNTPLSGENPQN